MLIQNYGLLWHRDDVEWGYRGRGTRGRLLGLAARRKKSDYIDFRDQQGVYVLYDDTFRIVYIGQTGSGTQRLLVRLRQHKSDHLAQRWSKFSWFGIIPVEDGNLVNEYEPDAPSLGVVLDHMEAVLIAASEPPLNLQRGRFGKDVEQYIQYIEEEQYEEEETEG